MSLGNAQVQRSSVALGIGTVTANTTKDVTFANSNAVYDSANPLNTDRVIVAPAAALSTGVAVCEAFVSAASVITARCVNVTTANVVAGSPTCNVELIKATGGI